MIASLFGFGLSAYAWHRLKQYLCYCEHAGCWIQKNLAASPFVRPADRAPLALETFRTAPR